MAGGFFLHGGALVKLNPLDFGGFGEALVPSKVQLVELFVCFVHVCEHKTKMPFFSLVICDVCVTARSSICVTPVAVVPIPDVMPREQPSYCQETCIMPDCKLPIFNEGEESHRLFYIIYT